MKQIIAFWSNVELCRLYVCFLRHDGPLLRVGYHIAIVVPSVLKHSRRIPLFHIVPSPKVVPQLVGTYEGPVFGGGVCELDVGLQAIPVHGVIVVWEDAHPMPAGVSVEHEEEIEVSTHAAPLHVALRKEERLYHTCI